MHVIGIYVFEKVDRIIQWCYSKNTEFVVNY